MFCKSGSIQQCQSILLKVNFDLLLCFAGYQTQTPGGGFWGFIPPSPPEIWAAALDQSYPHPSPLTKAAPCNTRDYAWVIFFFCAGLIVLQAVELGADMAGGRTGCRGGPPRRPLAGDQLHRSGFAPSVYIVSWSPTTDPRALLTTVN